MEIPEKGFYYHYKHDSEKEINDYAYEVLGVALATEERDMHVIYKALYDVSEIAPAEFFIRPLGMFMETVEKEGKTFSRFSKITDPEIIEKLEALKISSVS